MTIFQDIIDGKIPCEKLYENEALVAFKDIAPQAPIHILIVPKIKAKGLQDLRAQDLYIMEEVVKAAQKLAKEFKIEDGYRLVTNNGSAAGQTVFHLHFHLLGGQSLSDELA